MRIGLLDAALRSHADSAPTSEFPVTRSCDQLQREAMPRKNVVNGSSASTTASALSSEPNSIKYRFQRGLIRKLLPHEWEKLRDHLLRLDTEARRMRFAHPVSDALIREHVATTREDGSVVYAYLEHGLVCAAAELHKLGDTWRPEAEAAFSVEGAYQDAGIGTELMTRIIRAARNRGVRRLFMACLAENGRMQRIARKNAAELRFRCGDVVGEIVPPEPSYLSYLGEAFEDGVSTTLAVLEIGQSSTKKEP